MEIEDNTAHMENLHTQPDVREAPAKSPLSRRERRLQEKQQAEEVIREKKRVAASAKQLQNNIHELLKIYTDGYNDYAQQNPGNTRSLLGLEMPWSLNQTSVPLTELIDNSRDPNLNAYSACMDPANPGHVNVMYMRVDMRFHLGKDSTAVARPGIPEQVTESAVDGTKIHIQLFYHAVYPLSTQADEDLINKAKEKLLADFMVHVFCMGVDMQQMNNNNLWQQRLNKQTETINEKVEEVNEIFSHVGEAKMKVVE